MGEQDQRIEAFFAETGKWQAELAALRAILIDCGLTEEFKWRGPCYTFDGGNVAVIWGFKDNPALGFFKGVLLQDAENLLVAPGDNSRVVRMFRFTGLDHIRRLEAVLKAYVHEAIELEKSGARVELPKDDIVYPEELIAALEQDPELSEAFEALTPGRRRGYAIYFGQPKQAATREGRIVKMREKILAGKGYQER